jgi:hypothetical protein
MNDQTATDEARVGPVKVMPPLASEIVKAIALDHGVCIRPVPMRRTDLDTGESDVQYIPCGHTLASVCTPCAERNRKLRATQCREGWHLDVEPVIERADPDEEQRMWIELRAQAQGMRDLAAKNGEPVEDLDAAIAEIDAEIERCGVKGSLKTGEQPDRRTRSTKRRSDAADLPKRPVDKRTIGQTYTGRDGKTFRPSLFVTLTLDTYGAVHGRRGGGACRCGMRHGKDDPILGTPLDPNHYDYTRAARDALHFSKLVDRFIQNLRRFVGYDVQYFAAIEPQRRYAPHVHMAIRGTISRTELRQVVAATYAQVWWPPVNTVKYAGADLPVWDPDAGDPDEEGARTGTYVDPDTHEQLQTWHEALDAIGDDDDPLHVVRFGPQVDAQGVLGDSADSRRCIGYLTKYLTKQVAECHDIDTEEQGAHADRLAEALRYEPCSPTCANWLRYGVQPKDSKPGMTPGYCKGKAHRREHLGYGGRRVLVSRKWSGKTVADHKADRKNWVLARLAEVGVSAIDIIDPAKRYAWERAAPDDPDVMPLDHRLLLLLDQRITRRAQLDQAKTDLNLSAIPVAA